MYHELRFIELEFSVLSQFAFYLFPNTDKEPVKTEEESKYGLAKANTNKETLKADAGT